MSGYGGWKQGRVPVEIEGLEFAAYLVPAHREGEPCGQSASVARVTYRSPCSGPCPPAGHSACDPLGQAPDQRCPTGGRRLSRGRLSSAIVMPGALLVTPYACNGTMPEQTFTPDPSVKITCPFCHASYSRFHSFSRRKPLLRSRCSGIHPVKA